MIVTRPLWALFFSLLFSGTNSYSKPEQLTLNQVEGVSGTQILKEAYQSLGINLTIKVQPASRGLVSANNGSIDGEVNRIPGLNEKFGNLLMVDVPVFFVNIVPISARSDIKIESWNDLKKYKVGTMNGLKIAEKHLDPLMPYKKAPNFESLFSMLAKKRIEVAIAPYMDSLEHIKAKGHSFKVHEKSLDQIKLFHYLHKKHKDLLPDITKSLKALEQNGRIQSYFESVAKSLK